MSTRASALETVVFGVDVQSGDVRGESPSFAVVAFDGEHTDRDVVSFRKLRRLLQREEPDVLAVDNVYELAADKDALIRFCRELPSHTKLVQVTGGHRPEPLSRVAARHGVEYGKQPMKEAEAAARLAAVNVGQVVRAFGDTTTVKVSRGRSTGSGGWSEDRYTRRIHGAVKSTARSVESKLSEAGLSYTVERTEKYGGLSQALFTVEASPDELPVGQMRSGDVRIEIERERYDGIEFEPLAKRRDRVFVGIDPGTTTGVAIVGLGGTVLDVHSTRTADTAALIEWIIERGRPLLIASDVTPMPETVEKFRRSFDAAGWEPEMDLPVDRKQHRTRAEGYDDDHQRDAMAAALFAFDAHEPQLDRINEKIPAPLDRGAVTERVLTGSESVEAVVEDLTETDDPDETTDTESATDRSPEKAEIDRLRDRIDRLENHIESLESTIEDRDETIAELEHELSNARRDERLAVRRMETVSRKDRQISEYESTIADQQDEIEALTGKLERLKTLWKIDHSNFTDVAAQAEGLVPVKPIEQFTMEAIEAADTDYGLVEDDVLLLRDASGAGKRTAERLAATSPRIVLKHGGLSDVADRILFENSIPVAQATAVTIQEIDELAVAREREIAAAIERWTERAEERRRDRTAAMVDQLISEHRADQGTSTNS